MKIRKLEYDWEEILTMSSAVVGQRLSTIIKMSLVSQLVWFNAQLTIL